MELRHLRYFLAVAEELHFGRAAQRLHMAQPPLSQQIQRLERELGLQLFERTKRQVRLTRAGELLLAEARRTVTQAERVLDVAQQVRTGESGRVRIGFVGSALYGGLPRLFRALRAQVPYIQLSALEMETGAQLRGLAEDRIDLGFIRPPITSRSLAVRDIGADDLVVALPSDHPLPAGEPVRLEALAGEPWVLFHPEHGTGFWDAVLRACGAAGFTPRVVYEAEHIHTMVGIVASGVGVSLVPAPVRRLGLWGVRYERIAGDAPQLRLALAWYPQRSFPALERFIEIITEEMRYTGPSR